MNHAGATETEGAVTLYHSPGACSMATAISLFEAGLTFDVKIISLKNNEQSLPEFAAINPKKKVPYLLVDGKGLSENVAIQSWISETNPDAQLLPSDLWDKQRALSYMSWFGSGIHPHITRHYKPAKFCAVENAHDNLKSKARAMHMEQMDMVEQELAGKTFFFAHYTACDSYFFWIYDRSLREGFDVGSLPNCTAHNERMRDRESVQKALALS